MTESPPFPAQYLAGLALDRALGPAAGGFADTVALDEREAFPQPLMDQLLSWGLARYFVPAELGGRLSSHEELFCLFREVARRDLTAAIALGQTFLGALPVWLAGSSDCKRSVADDVLAGHPGALALTEEAHGSDILSCETRAERVAGGYRLTGAKWLINNGSRGKRFTVFARTEPTPGPRSYTLFSVDRSLLGESDYSCLPKIRTLGIRGADISGIAFRGAVIAEGARIGEPGSGFEVVLQSLQVSRATCAALSIGATETALHIVTRFARDRRLYGDTALAIPHVRDTLLRAYGDLLAAEALMLVVARTLHARPAEMSLLSAVVKYVVPSRLDATVSELAQVFGARYYLRDHPSGGLFQKIARETPLVALFDGSTAVNLDALSQELRVVAQRAARGHSAADDASPVFRLRDPLPRFDPGAMEVFSKGKSAVISGLFELAESLPADSPFAGRIAELARGLLTHYRSVLEEAGRRSAHGRAWERTTAAFDLARRYALCCAGAACAGLWLANRREADTRFAGGGWLALCLGRIDDLLIGRATDLAPDVVDAVMPGFVEASQNDRGFSNLHSLGGVP